MTWTELMAEFRSRIGNPTLDEYSDRQLKPYLQGGFEAVNRRVGFYVKDDETTITITNGGKEYSVPADFVSPVFVEWNGALLAKSDIDTWRQHGILFRTATGNAPTEYALYGRKIIFYPIPNGVAVAADANPMLRYVATPPDVETNLALCASQDHRLILYYAVAEWDAAKSQPGSRTGPFYQMFDGEAKLAALAYGERSLNR